MDGYETFIWEYNPITKMNRLYSQNTNTWLLDESNDPTDRINLYINEGNNCGSTWIEITKKEAFIEIL